MLTDPFLMSPKNFADGYDVLSGDVDQHHPSNTNYGEVHTGDAWIPARDRFCSNTGEKELPVALIIFGDKLHTDLHDTLALTPIIFTLSLFNRESRNYTRFWRPIGYIPNLSYSRGLADRRSGAANISHWSIG